YSAMDLRTMQDWIVARQLYGTPGVAEVNSFGGLLKQYEVSVDPNRIKAMGVSISDIFTALENNNQNTGGAYIDKKPNAYFIRGVGLVTSLEDVGNIVVKNTGSVPVFVKDVAKVQFGHATRYGAMTYNGEVDAVGGIVMMLKGENRRRGAIETREEGEAVGGRVRKKKEESGADNKKNKKDKRLLSRQSSAEGGLITAYMGVPVWVDGAITTKRKASRFTTSC